MAFDFFKKLYIFYFVCKKYLERRIIKVRIPVKLLFRDAISKTRPNLENWPFQVNTLFETFVLNEVNLLIDMTSYDNIHVYIKNTYITCVCLCIVRKLFQLKHQLLYE